MNKKIISLGYLLILVLAVVACGLISRLQISGQVWQDNNDDGVKSSDEPGLSGVSVKLYKVEDGAAVEAGTEVTDEDGRYRFNIDEDEPADLEIRVAAPKDAQFTKQNVGTSDQVDSDVNTAGSSGTFPAREAEDKKEINAGLVVGSQEVATSTETDSEPEQPTATPAKIVEPTPMPTIAPQETPVVDTETSIAPPLTTTLSITSSVGVPDSGVLSQSIPDGLNDAIDCEKTLAPTGQDLLFDITEVGWVNVDDKIKFFLQFDEPVESLLENVGGEDFLGVGWGLFDPQAEVFSDSDPSWLANVSANNSFDAIYDPENGEFFGTLFMVQDGSWIEAPGVEYPVVAAGNYITMTITDVPQKVTGFATAVHFDAEEGQLSCDWAGLDEIVYSDTIQEIIDSLDSVDPQKMADTYLLELPEQDLGPGGSLSSLPPIDGTYLVTTTVISGKVHEQFVEMDESMPLSVTMGLTPTQAIHVEGPGAWVAVDGPLADDGSFSTSGSGPVAGIPGIDVALVGTITNEFLTAVYTMGDGGGLPGEEPIVFNVSGFKLTEEQPLDYFEAIDAFYIEFNDAFQTQDVDYLFNNLHPAVIDLYGSDSCQSYLTNVIDNPVSVEILEISGPSFWEWERDDNLLPIENAFTISANVSVAGQTQQQEMHVADVDNDILWFTDCGDPLN